MHGTGKIVSFVNQPSQKHLQPIPNIVLNIFFLNYKHLMYCG